MKDLRDAADGRTDGEAASHLVCYFSGTGNSRHVARRIASALGAETVAVDECLRSGRLRLPLAEGATVGVVFPVYFWGLPTLVREFLRGVEFSPSPAWLYDVATFGTTLGEVHRQFRKEAAARGWTVGGSYGVRMVDVWTPMFDLSDSARNLKRTEAAEIAIDRVVGRLGERRTGGFHWSNLPHWLAGFYYRTYERQRRTDRFHVLKERCTTCGLCVRRCPVRAISPDADGFPLWRKPQCVLCLRCLHHCPFFAIHYGTRTLRHGQFVHPDK